MVTLNVIEYLNDEGEEVLLEVCQNDIKLYTFCYPYTGEKTDTKEKVTLYALFAHNIGPSLEFKPPCKTSEIAFNQHIHAKIVSKKERLVSIGDISIILDAPIDSEFPVGSFISFDVVRLDL